MADGRWVMTTEELNNVVCSMNPFKNLPNYGKHIAVDNRDGQADKACALCGCLDLQEGRGGYGAGFGYLSSQCKKCGGTTDFVYKDEVGKYFK